MSIVVNLVALGSHQQQIHLAGVRPPAQDLEVDLYVLDIERDMLLGLPVDLLVELVLRHHGNGDFPNDNALSRDAEGNLTLPDLRFLARTVKRLDDDAGVHHLAVYDGLGRQRGEAEADQHGPLARVFYLAGLDRAGPDIDADQVPTFAHLASRGNRPQNVRAKCSHRAGLSGNN